MARLRAGIDAVSTNPESSSGPLGRGRPRVLSEPEVLEEESKVQSGRRAEGADALTCLMHDADSERGRIFGEAIASTRHGGGRRNLKRTTAGAHVGFQLAQTSTQQVFCCGACGAHSLA